MSRRSAFWRLVNIAARVVGLTFTAAGIYFAGRGVYFLIQPEAAGSKDILGFSPAFAPAVMASVSLIIGVHFIRGEAHRPDLLEQQRSERAPGRTHGWWTGEPTQTSTPERDE
ncbi:MAG: hypothetical protein O7H39_11015 [Gammaproteobacteria bacterium]|nr:hypothetical protein [Gammaproteobacteria bacterium]